MTPKQRLDDLLYHMFELAAVMFLASIWHVNLFLRVLPHSSLTGSRLIYFGLCAVLWIVFGLITPRNKRNFLTALIGGLTPGALYFIVSFWDIRGSFFALFLWAMAIPVALLAALTVALHLPSVAPGRIRDFIGGLFHRCRMIFCGGLALVYLFFLIGGAFGLPLLRPSAPAVSPTAEQITMEDHTDTILLLDRRQWETLSLRERLDVLQTIANIEACHLGLSHELNLCMEDATEGKLAHYNENRRIVSVSTEYLKTLTGFELAHAVLHEAYHAYEYELVAFVEEQETEDRNLLFLRRITEYQENLTDYTPYEEDPDRYANQAVEVDSDKYADVRIQDYVDFMIQRGYNPL